ncbi:MAG TPA: metallophosphoesterase [Bacteroidetes bacterium]|nr:metallophosphoesterase [Bacteroidota bacterium]
MKIALFSDIHANLPALEAVLVDMERRKPDAIYCLGDLVGYNVWPNEVVQEIQRRGIPCISGNYDQGVGRNSPECGCAYNTAEQVQSGAASIAYTNDVIGDAERAYLRMLPFHLQIQFQVESAPQNLLLVHGSPRQINEYLFEHRTDRSLLKIMEGPRADIMCFGHTHIPYHRVLKDLDEKGAFYRHAINIGSVGKPKDGDPRACYVMLDLQTNMRRGNSDGIQVEFVRVEYDVERAAKGVEDSPLPNALAEALRLGR